jgi:hypothetical protein
VKNGYVVVLPVAREVRKDGIAAHFTNVLGDRFSESRDIGGNDATEGSWREIERTEF